MNPIPGPVGLYRIFYTITGAGLIALFIGFGQCLFDMDQIGQCADHAQFAFDTFKAFGDHIVKWSIALFQEIMSRSHG